MDLPLDYPTLRIIWWGLLGVLLIGFALTDGYDMMMYCWMMVSTLLQHQ